MSFDQEDVADETYLREVEESLRATTSRLGAPDCKGFWLLLFWVEEVTMLPPLAQFTREEVSLKDGRPSKVMEGILKQIGVKQGNLAESLPECTLLTIDVEG